MASLMTVKESTSRKPHRESKSLWFRPEFVSVPFKAFWGFTLFFPPGFFWHHPVTPLARSAVRPASSHAPCHVMPAVPLWLHSHSFRCLKCPSPPLHPANPCVSQGQAEVPYPLWTIPHSSMLPARTKHNVACTLYFRLGYIILLRCSIRSRIL